MLYFDKAFNRENNVEYTRKSLVEDPGSRQATHFEVFFEGCPSKAHRRAVKRSRYLRKKGSNHRSKPFTLQVVETRGIEPLTS